MIFNIPFSDIIFYLVALFMIITALFTVLSKNILRSAIFLIATFLGTAALYLLLHAEFMAMAQIMLYVGGVVVFIIFAILLTSRLGEQQLNSGLKKKFFALILSVGFISIIAKCMISVHKTLPTNPTQHVDSSSLAAYGERFLSFSSNGFLIPFEIISVLLLMTLVAAITLAKKEDKEEK